MRKGTGLFMYAAALGALLIPNEANTFSRVPEILPATDDQKRERLEKYYLSKGMKKFNYPEGSVWARDQKNADRKAKTLWKQ